MSFAEIFRRTTRDEWVAEFMPAETSVAAVYSVDEVVRDPHVQQRESIVEAEWAGQGARKQVGMMLKFSETPGRLRRPGPELGQDTAEVLSEFGYDEAAIEALERAGAIARHNSSKEKGP